MDFETLDLSIISGISSRCLENQEESLQQKVSLRRSDDVQLSLCFNHHVSAGCLCRRRSLIIICVEFHMRSYAIRGKELRRGPLDFIARSNVTRTQFVSLSFEFRGRSSMEHRVQPIFHPFSPFPTSSVFHLSFLALGNASSGRL